MSLPKRLPLKVHLHQQIASNGLVQTENLIKINIIKDLVWFLNKMVWLGLKTIFTGENRPVSKNFQSCSVSSYEVEYNSLAFLINKQNIEANTILDFESG